MRLFSSCSFPTYLHPQGKHLDVQWKRVLLQCDYRPAHGPGDWRGTASRHLRHGQAQKAENAEPCTAHVALAPTQPSSSFVLQKCEARPWRPTPATPAAHAHHSSRVQYGWRNYWRVSQDLNETQSPHLTAPQSGAHTRAALRVPRRINR